MKSYQGLPQALMRYRIARPTLKVAAHGQQEPQEMVVVPCDQAEWPGLIQPGRGKVATRVSRLISIAHRHD